MALEETGGNNFRNGPFAHVVRGAIEETKIRIRERIREETQKIADEEVGKLFARLQFDMTVDNEAFSGNVNVGLIVKGVGDQCRGSENSQG